MRGSTRRNRPANQAAPRSPRRERALQTVIEALRPYAPDRIYLFGSWASGEEDDLSDLDLVVIKRTRAAFFERLSEVARLLPPQIGGIDLLVYTPEEFEEMGRAGNAFAELIADEGRLVYGGEAESRS